MFFLVFLALLLLFAAGLMLRRAAVLRKATGLPQGEVVYDDSGARREVEEPLLSRRYGLVGRPDYLVRSEATDDWIPVEVKSARAPARPYDSHVLQLGAYCLLVEDRYGRRPDYGLLRYADASFRIPFTDALRYQVLDAADAIRRARTAPNVQRSHAEPARCRACGYRDGCGESLARNA
ncbi:MAG: Dna2/Cas4 domain-containing protein [Caldilineaceae bacterium]|nr:Dna2/Cas4 domain-containing protein [Caldilineaceae bacterium]